MTVVVIGFKNSHDESIGVTDVVMRPPRITLCLRGFNHLCILMELCARGSYKYIFIFSKRRTFRFWLSSSIERDLDVSTRHCVLLGRSSSRVSVLVEMI